MNGKVDGKDFYLSPWTGVLRLVNNNHAFFLLFQGVTNHRGHFAGGWSPEVQFGEHWQGFGALHRRNSVVRGWKSRPVPDLRKDFYSKSTGETLKHMSESESGSFLKKPASKSKYICIEISKQNIGPSMLVRTLWLWKSEDTIRALHFRWAQLKGRFSILPRRGPKTWSTCRQLRISQCPGKSRQTSQKMISRPVLIAPENSVTK